MSSPKKISNDPPVKYEPQNKRMWCLLTLYLIVMTIGLCWLCWYGWNEFGEAGTDKTAAMIVIISTSGALGGLIHSCRSFYFHAIKADMSEGRAHKYILRPFTGAVLAIIFFYAAKSLMPQEASSSMSEERSLIGYAAVAALVGMFTDQASAKLQTIAEGILSKPEKPDQQGG